MILGQPFKVYGVEVSGVCNFESKCQWCPMYQKPRLRKRGLMAHDTVERALHWVERLGKVDALALHNFGEPLLHPKFDEIALRFSKLVPITMSTNATFLDEAWADRLAKVPWAWISLSPWDKPAQERAARLLEARAIRYCFPEGVTHNWAGQAKEGGTEKIFKECTYLRERKVVIRWDGSVASCCVSDRAEDAIGHVNSEPHQVKMRGYSLCETCHHAVEG